MSFLCENWVVVDRVLVLATIPTVGDAIEALNGLCDDLAATLKQIADLSAELSSRDHIRVDNIQEVCAVFGYHVVPRV